MNHAFISHCRQLDTLHIRVVLQDDRIMSGHFRPDQPVSDILAALYEPGDLQESASTAPWNNVRLVDFDEDTGRLRLWDFLGKAPVSEHSPDSHESLVRLVRALRKPIPSDRTETQIPLPLPKPDSDFPIQRFTRPAYAAGHGSARRTGKKPPKRELSAEATDELFAKFITQQTQGTTP